MFIGLKAYKVYLSGLKPIQSLVSLLTLDINQVLLSSARTGFK